MFRLEHLINLGLYDENFLVHEDKDLRLRFNDKYKVFKFLCPYTNVNTKKILQMIKENEITL